MARDPTVTPISPFNLDRELDLVAETPPSASLGISGRHDLPTLFFCFGSHASLLKIRFFARRVSRTSK